MGVQSELPEYMRRLARMPEDVHQAIGVGHRVVIPRMTSTIRGDAPVLTGELRDSIVSEVSIVDHYNIASIIYTLCVYAPIHERGGWHPVFDSSKPYHPIVYQPERPYFVPGVLKHFLQLLEAQFVSIEIAARKAGFK